MEYIAKLRLNKTKYLAVLDKALVIVTEDANGKPVRWAVFNGNPDSSEVKNLIQEYTDQTGQSLVEKSTRFFSFI